MLEIITIVDRSGSMQEVKSDAIGGLNSFLERQKREAPDSRFTLVQFDAPFQRFSQFGHGNRYSNVDEWYEIVHNGVPIDSVPFLTERSFMPRGGTALYDGIGKTLDDVGRRLHNTPVHLRPSKVLVAILTDGDENSSTMYDSWKIQGMINHQRSVYSWEFVFLAANQDAVATGGRIGIPIGAAINLRYSGAGYRAVGETMSYAANCVSKGLAADGMDLQHFYNSTVKTEEEKS